VSFPVQVLAKAAKVIPVMLMGRVVSRQTYPLSEYLTAGMISAGLFMFVMSTDAGIGHGHPGSNISTLSGVILLAGYLMFDAFTSNWQGKLFRMHHMSSTQMMAGSNLFAVVFAGVSLIEQGGFVDALSFMIRHPSFVTHIAILSVTSGIGQLFIYYTIAEFGPVTFTIIMTVRQGFAILLSCITYNHYVGFSGIIGIIMCFIAIFFRTYSSHQQHIGTRKAPSVTLTRVSVAMRT
jgi:adenosine 3'-phospho 5'-phosphosulfate transporter B2